MEIDDKPMGEAYKFDEEQKRDVPQDFINVVLQNGGYGNVIFNMLYLL